MLFCAILLAVCFLPAYGATIGSWYNSVGTTIEYYWFISGINNDLVIFSALIPEGFHFQTVSPACGWAFASSKYDKLWQKYLEPAPPGMSWVYFYRVASGSLPDTELFSFATDCGEPGSTRYGIVTGNTAKYGSPVIAPVAVPEPTSLTMMLMLGLGLWRRRSF